MSLSTSTCGLPAAPETYRSRTTATGYGHLDGAIAELAQQSWIQILRVDPGQLMPGSLDEDEANLAASGADGKNFVVQTMGLEQYHQARIKIVVRVFSFPTFQEWVTSLGLFIHMAHTVCEIQMHPVPGSLLFSLTFPYNDPAIVPAIGMVINHSLRNIPV